MRTNRRETLADLDSDPWLTPYGKLVTEFRDKLSNIEKQARVYHDEGAAPNERELAYERLECIVKDLKLSVATETLKSLKLET